MAGSQDIPKRPPKCLGKKTLTVSYGFPGFPAPPGSVLRRFTEGQRWQRRLEKVREGWRRLEKVREAQRRSEKGQRRSEKVREGQRRSEKVGESMLICMEGLLLRLSGFSE